MKRVRVIKDLLLNLIAFALPLVTIQLFIFPYISELIGGNEYGKFLSIYSLINIIPGAIGTTLNNTRLIHSKEYEKNTEGDFPILVLLGSFINIVLLISVFFIDGELTSSNFIFLLFTSIIILLHGYFIVEFRINLNFKHIVYNNIFLVIGYLIGVFLFRITNNWYLIFICGYLLSLIYILLNTVIWKEPIQKTSYFKYVFKDSAQLLIGTFLLRISTYADKIILFPILGGTAVSIYYSATILSKMISLLITPINSVVLSYLSKLNEKPKKLFNKILLVSGMLGIIGYFLSLGLSEIILQLLYPQFVNRALEYVPITSAITVFTMLASVVQPFVLKFSSMKYQILINSLDVFVYILASLLLLKNFGLLGFSIGVLISKIFRFFLLLFVYYTKDKEST